MYLCCDLGGTKADWAVFDPASERFVFRVDKDIVRYEDFYEMMDEILDEFGRLVGEDTIITNTTLGVAGPTNHAIVSPTNIQGWRIKIETANAILSDHGHNGYSSIVNDFEALGYGILYFIEKSLDKSDLCPIYGRFRMGPARVGDDSGTRSLVCGPGTGLGVACIVDGLEKDGFPYIISSEGGHHTLAPETPEQFRYLSRDGAFSGKRSYEEALSKSGLRSLYNFFRREDHGVEPNYEISAEQIIALARNGNDQAATDAIELFCSFLANFCGNAALTFNCDKAVFLWGGALLEMPSELLTTRFKNHYPKRCNHSDRIRRVPVVLLTNKDLPLLGCAYRSSFELQYLAPSNE